MINVKYMKPYYTKVTGSKLRLTFAYQYFSIVKEDEVFHFIPIEGKEIIYNIKTKQVENLSEVFVFQRGNRFIRLPLYQLLLVSNVHDHLMPIIEGASGKYDGGNSFSEDDDDYEEDCFDDGEDTVEDEDYLREDTKLLVKEIERFNIKNLIDNALDNNDLKSFTELTSLLNER